MPATGHTKNVANFETATIILTNLGDVYNPGQPLILLPALQAKLTAAKDALAAVDQAEAAKKIAVNARVAEFDAIIKLAVNVKRTAEVEVNDDAFTKNLAAVIRKLRGERAGDAPVDDPATPDVDESKNTRSVSARGFDNLVAYFAVIIAMLKTQPDYDPNETDVKIVTLEAKFAAMKAKKQRRQSSRRRRQISPRKPRCRFIRPGNGHSKTGQINQGIHQTKLPERQPDV